MNNEAIVLKGDKHKIRIMSIVTTLFVVVGISMILTGDSRGWYCVGFFGFCLLFCLCMLRPGAIIITLIKNGVGMKFLLSKKLKFVWNDVETFYVKNLQTGYAKTKLVGIKFSDSYKERHAGKKLATLDGNLPLASYFNMTAEELCELLNNTKQRWN